MCLFNKENGEQCGNDSEPFCRHHEDSHQSDIYQTALTAAQSDLKSFRMETTCSGCGTSLHRRERLTEHPNMNGRVTFEAYVECDCGEYVLGSKSSREGRVPDGWLDE